MFFAMIEVFKGAGVLIYPLGICSAAAVFIVCERAYALRHGGWRQVQAAGGFRDRTVVHDVHEAFQETRVHGNKMYCLKMPLSTFSFLMAGPSWFATYSKEK